MDVIAVLHIGLIMIIGYLVIGFGYNYFKIKYGVPWMQWLTFNEIAALGHSPFWLRVLLPVFHQMNDVQIRIPDDISEQDFGRVKKAGLYFGTAALYDYKFTEKSGRRDEKPDKRQHLIPQFLPV